jgi:O-antigen ligase
MKYYVFSFALLGVIPLAYLLFLNGKWMRYVLWGMALAMFAWQSSSINFLSHEEYRGSSRGMEVSLLYLLSFAILLALMLRGKVRKALPEGGFWLYMIYFLLCLPSFSTAESVELAWCETWKMIMLYAFSLSVFYYLRATGDVHSLLMWFAVVVIGNFVVVAKAHFAGVYQPHGIFPHRNCMGMAMNLMGPMFFAAYLMHGMRTWRGIVFALAGMCAGIAALWTYSRGSIAVMPIGYGIAALACFFAKKPKIAVLKRTAPLVIIGIVGFAVMLPRIIDRFVNAPEASGNTRVELARCALEMIKDEPIRGVGINNWGIKINPPYEYAELAGRNVPEGVADGVVETVYLLVGAECGIPALLAMLVWFGWYLVLAVRLMRRLWGTRWFFIPAGVAGGLATNYLQSVLEWVLRQQMNLVCLVGVFAMLSYLGVEWRRMVDLEKQAYRLGKERSQ